MVKKPPHIENILNICILEYIYRLMQKHVGSSKRFYGDELRRSVSRRRNAVFACARTRVSTVGFVTKRVSSHFDGVERLRREQVINSPSATVKLNNPQACINYYPRKSYHSHICKQLIHSEIIWIIFYTTLTKNCIIFLKRGILATLVTRVVWTILSPPGSFSHDLRVWK